MSSKTVNSKEIEQKVIETIETCTLQDNRFQRVLRKADMRLLLRDYGAPG